MEILYHSDQPPLNVAENEVSLPSSVIQQAIVTISSNEELTREKIQHLLKFKKDQYVIIDNVNNKKSSDCWRLFGFPAAINENGDHQRIEKFVSCKKCFTTYSYVSNSTTFLKKHRCDSLHRSNNTSSSTSSRQPTVYHSQRLITDYGNPKSFRLPDNCSKDMKDLIVRWVCRDMRPFAVVDDIGFREIAQRCVSIGMSDFFLECFCSLDTMNQMEMKLFVLGAQYGNVDVNQVLRCANTISSHIHQVADQERFQLKKFLGIAVKNRSLCLCPDLWTDNNQQCSYLGIAASFVDDQYRLHNIDLCCHPFPSVKKTAENIIIVSVKMLFMKT